MKRFLLTIIMAVSMLAATACAPRLMSIHVDMPASKSPQAFTKSVVIKGASDLREFGSWQTSPPAAVVGVRHHRHAYT